MASASAVGQVRDRLALRREDRRRGARRSSRRRGRRACASSPTTMPARSAPAMPIGACGTTAADPVAELRRMMAVRARRDRPLRPGARSPPASRCRSLRRAFVPIWLLDRYQVEAAAKSVGGVDFPYARQRREAGRATPCRARRQWAALYALLDTLTPAELTVPARLQPLLSSGFGGEQRPADRHRDHPDRRRAGVRSARRRPRSARCRR